MRFVAIALTTLTLVASAVAGDEMTSRNYRVRRSALDAGGSAGLATRGGRLGVSVGQGAPTGVMTGAASSSATVVVGSGFWSVAGGPIRTARCGGDCGEDGAVTVDELIRGVNIALGVAGIDTCSAVDINGDGAVTIDELITAVRNALDGCPE